MFLPNANIFKKRHVDLENKKLLRQPCSAVNKAWTFQAIYKYYLYWFTLINSVYYTLLVLSRVLYIDYIVLAIDPFLGPCHWTLLWLAKTMLCILLYFPWSEHSAWAGLGCSDSAVHELALEDSGLSRRDIERLAISNILGCLCLPVDLKSTFCSRSGGVGTGHLARSMPSRTLLPGMPQPRIQAPWLHLWYTPNKPVLPKPDFAQWECSRYSELIPSNEWCPATPLIHRSRSLCKGLAPWVMSSDTFELCLESMPAGFCRRASFVLMSRGDNSWPPRHLKKQSRSITSRNCGSSCSSWYMSMVADSKYDLERFGYLAFLVTVLITWLSIYTCIRLCAFAYVVTGP